MNYKLKIFILMITISAVTLFIFLFPTMPAFSEVWLPMLFFVIIAIMAEYLPVPLPAGGRITVAFPISFLVILVYGPPLAMILEALSVFWELFKKKEPWYKTIFNAAQYALSAGLAGMVYL
ncbi:MAG: hypothetical protein KBI07_04405, partial [Candidatus Atribacteria bacterium]|nr:hypothetical protein [Candidatus Atribacteria bacterium]